MKKTVLMLLVALLMVSVAPVQAEDSTATLRVDRGTVMTSTGGEFVPANSGAVVSTGDRLMVAENSAATVIYGDGCDQEYTEPGVYEIEPECRRAAYIDWRSAGIITGAVVIGAIILDPGHRNPPVPPISR